MRIGPRRVRNAVNAFNGTRRLGHSPLTALRAAAKSAGKLPVKRRRRQRRSVNPSR